MDITAGQEAGARLEQLRSQLEKLQFPLDTPAAATARRRGTELVHQLDDYLMPRIQRLNAPLLAVVGGSTGAGKSTLVNGLVGHPVTRAGAVRPTTRQPILLHHPADGPWFSNARILPGLARVTGTVVKEGEQVRASSAGVTPDAAAIHSLVLVADRAVPAGLALLDAPDVDSVADENRQLAAQLLAAADLWVFVTTANRYADQVPWEMLQEAARRDTTVAVVLDRVDPEAVEAVQEDLARVLVERGLGAAPLFIVEERELDAQGMLPARSTAALRGWLHRLAEDSGERDAVMLRTLRGSLGALTRQLPELSAAAQEQVEAAAALRAAVVEEYDAAVRHIVDSTKDGQLLRGELLSRWQDFVGTGEFFRSLESKISKLRDQVGAFLTGKPKPAAQVEIALESGLQTLFVSQADQAADRVARRWAAEDAGRPLLAGGDFTRASAGFSERAAREIRAWQEGILELIRTEGEGKRQKARILSFGVNGLATTLMVVVFASTAGLTGAEFGIAAGSAAIGQKLLESIFGEDAVRRLAETVREDLRIRCEGLMEQESTRFLDTLDALPLDPTGAAGLAPEGKAVLAALEQRLDGQFRRAADTGADDDGPVPPPTEPSSTEPDPVRDVTGEPVPPKPTTLPPIIAGEGSAS